MKLWVNSLTSSDFWAEQFGKSYDQNKPVGLVSYANGSRGLIITWQHECPIISVCCSVPGGQLFCNNGHAQPWTARIPLSCSPPHSILMREEPRVLKALTLSCQDPRTRAKLGEVLDLMLGTWGKRKKDSEKWLSVWSSQYFASKTVSHSDLTKHNFGDRSIGILPATLILLGWDKSTQSLPLSGWRVG